MTAMRDSALEVVDASPGDEIPNVQPLVEQGRSGLKRNSGYVDDEFLPSLRGRKGVAVYREIADNSAMVGAYLNAVMQLLRQIEWAVEPASQNAEDKANAQFVEQCMEDMEHSWGDMVMDVASFVIYGWQLSEIVYKKRIGPWEADPKRRSKYTDGKLGWRKIAGRAQETMLRWVFDDTGDIMAMVQMAPPRYERRVLPLSKCLLFRTTVAKNNPEGRSLLRNAVVPWMFLKRHMETEAVGIERDLTGVPIAKVPAKLLTAKPGTQDYAMLSAIKKLVTAVRRNEQEGIVWPWEIDADTKQPEYVFELLTSGGSRQFDISGIIDRYKTEILQSVLADFIMVGHENNGGSYALHTDKSGLFRTSMNSLAQNIADQFNRKAIPQLFSLNGMKPARLPTLKPHDVDPPNLTELAQFLSATGGLGLQWFPDPTLEKFIRDAARLPELDPAVEKIHEVEQRQAAILSLATQKLQMVQTEQQAVQGEMGIEQQQMSMAQQKAELEAGPSEQQADPGDPDGAHAQAQAGEATQQAGEKTSQAKLATQQAQSKAKFEQQQRQAQLQRDTDNHKAQLKRDNDLHQMRLQQEKQKLASLKKPAPKAAAEDKKKGPVKKSMSPFGVDHSYLWESA